MRGHVFAVIVALVGCGSSSPPKPAGPSSPPSETASAAPLVVAPSASAAPPTRPGRLARADVMATLSRGLGAFLVRLEVEPVLSGGRFHGWRIVRLPKTDPLWQNVDLAPGDVVTSVNGRPIERPEQALSAFQSLAIERELRVRYERDGVRKEIVYPIDDG